MFLKKISVFFLLVVGISFSSLCYGNALSVIVTLPPLHSLVASVMKGCGTPHLLIKGSMSEHNYSLRPSDATLLQKANIVFYASDHLEQFIPHMAKNINPNIFLAPMDQAKHLLLYPNREVPEASTPNSPSHKTLPYDVHFWLDPINAIALTSFISETLSEIDPKNSLLYKKNEAELIVRLQALDQFLQHSFTPLRTSSYYIFHDAYQYLEKRYHLSLKGILTHAHHHHIISLKSVDPLIRELKSCEKHTCCLFREPQFSFSGIESLTKETPVKIGIWDPMGADIPEGPENYFTLLQNLAKNFGECFL